jgi:transcriptional regulator with XRE-family HTH domain
MAGDLEQAAAILRDARRRAGLTQVEVARRAGVTQSVISTYESGHRQPSIPTLAGLVEAMGLELTLAVRRPTGRLQRLSGRSAAGYAGDGRS